MQTINRQKITVLVRRPEQIEALEGQAIQNVIMDFDWGVDSRKPMARIR
jgi:putative protease